MNSSVLLTQQQQQLSSPHTKILFTPFLTPTPLKLTTNSLTFNLRRYRYSRRVAVVRSSSSEQPTPASTTTDVFGGKKELSSFQSIVDSMTPAVRLASSVVVVAGAVAAGYGLGLRISGNRNASLGGAVVLGAAGAGAVYALNSSVPEIAAVSLHNYVAGSDPGELKKEDIESIASRYGVSKQNEAFNAELMDIYCRYVTSVLPSGGEDLNGDEADKIIKFKNSLGIDDPDAAAMHMEIGRRISRQRLETGDREGDAEQRRAFQKLIYVSTLVFGEASGFLLPWKRVFKVTESQVEVAIRDNAQRLYASKLKLIGQDIHPEVLISLRDAQLQCRLSDELAEDMLREHCRKLVEANISTSMNVLKSRTRTVEAKLIVEELDKILAFNNLLVSLKNHPDASRFARGVGPISLIGGEYDDDRKMDDLKLLYRAYIADSLSGGRMEKDKLFALSQLRNIFGLGKKEAESIEIDVTSKVYRKRLADSVTGGDLEATDSKAAFLQNLCEELHFDTEKAIDIHQEIYRQNLQNSVKDGELTDDEVKSLERLQVMLCIPKQTIEKIHEEICGTLFEKVVKEAIAAGVDGYDADVKQSVRKAAYGLRLTRQVAMSIAGKAVRKIFISYIQRSRASGSRTEAARELKKMIAFNNLVVTELVSDIKGESSDTPTKDEPIDVEAKPVDEIDDQEWESLQTLRKVKPAKLTMGKSGQTDITLKDDLPDRDRADLYKTYLLYCLTGEVTRVPFGAQITTKKDDSEYGFLKQLGGILGLNDKEIVEVHRSLAEQAFRQQAEVILADGQLTKARISQLNELQRQVGLPSEYAQKIIKNITSTKMAAALETAVGQGRLSIREIRELKGSGIELDVMVSQSLRQNLFKKTVDDIFSSGTGEFDEVEVYEKIPEDLSIDVEKARGVVHELARTRLSNSLIQAVSLLRQRNSSGVVSSLNDLLACDKAVAASPVSWEVPEELADLFLIYLKSDPAPENLSRLQYLLNINDTTAEALQGMKDRALPSSETSEEEFVF